MVCFREFEYGPYTVNNDEKTDPYYRFLPSPTAALDTSYKISFAFFRVLTLTNSISTYFVWLKMDRALKISSTTLPIYSSSSSKSHFKKNSCFSIKVLATSDNGAVPRSCSPQVSLPSLSVSSYRNNLFSLQELCAKRTLKLNNIGQKARSTALFKCYGAFYDFMFFFPWVNV